MIKNGSHNLNTGSCPFLTKSNKDVHFNGKPIEEKNFYGFGELYHKKAPWLVRLRSQYEPFKVIKTKGWFYNGTLLGIAKLWTSNEKVSLGF